MNILFNGPPSSGKDEGCEFLVTNFGFKHLSFKDQLFIDTINLFGVSEEWFMSGYKQGQKEIPEDKLDGLSRRDSLIHTSENVMKKKYGTGYYGTKTAEKLDNVSSYCFSDGGFADEIQPVINTIGRNNICIVQLFRDGCSFDRDSRNYVNGYVQDEFVIHHKSSKLNHGQPVLPVRCYQVHNNGNVSDFHQTIRKILRKELNVSVEKDRV